MRLFPESAMYRLPRMSVAMRSGEKRFALLAGPPSPPKLKLPFPAKVVIVPAAVTFRTTSLFVSAIKRLPDGSNANDDGAFIEALKAGPPSPPNPATPLPATGEYRPGAVTLKIHAEPSAK